MAETSYSYSDFLKRLTGRKVLLTSLTESDFTRDSIAGIVQYYYNAHCEEVPVMQFLYQFDLGIQPILEKQRNRVNASENNTIVINLARTARRQMQAAFLGEQLQYISKSDDKGRIAAVDQLKSIYDEEDEAEHNIRLENDRGIVGVAYEYVGLPTMDESEEENPLTLAVLSPLNTRIVKHNGIEKTDAFAFTFYTVYDKVTQEKTGYEFLVYTKTKIFQFKTDLNCNLQSNVFEQTNELNRLPITEYINNIERMGDFEAAIPCLNAINGIFSKRVDNVSDIVDSFLVWVNCSIFDEILDDSGKIIGYDTTRLEAFKKNKAIEIKGEPGLPADVKHIVQTLDQTQTQVLIDSLTNYAFAIMGVPNPINARSSGSSDSAEAVNKNEGWKSFEDLLKTKERYFRKSLKNRIKIIRRLKLFDNTLKNLAASLIDIKFIRTKVLNTQSNAQALDVLRRTGLFTEDTLASLSNLVENPTGEINKKREALNKFVIDGKITEQQKTIIELACLYPNVDINSILNSDEGETNADDGNSVRELSTTISQTDGNANISEV